MNVFKQIGDKCRAWLRQIADKCPAWLKEACNRCAAWLQAAAEWCRLQWQRLADKYQAQQEVIKRQSEVSHERITSWKIIASCRRLPKIILRLSP